MNMKKRLHAEKKIEQVEGLAWGALDGEHSEFRSGFSKVLDSDGTRSLT